MVRQVTDRSFFGGSLSKESVLPMGTKTKTDSSAMGAGGLTKYEDTSETIKSQQDMAISKIRSNPTKPGVKH